MSRIENLRKLVNQSGLEIAKIDEFVADTPGVSIKVVLERLKQREDLQNANGYLSHLLRLELEKQKEDKSNSSKIITMS